LTPAWSALERRPRSRREATGCWLSHERLLRSGPPLIEHTRQRQLLTRTAVLLRKTKWCTSKDALHSSSGRTVAAHLRATRGPRSARQARRRRRELPPLPPQPARQHLLRRRRDQRRLWQESTAGSPDEVLGLETQRCEIFARIAFFAQRKEFSSESLAPPGRREG